MRTPIGYTHGRWSARGPNLQQIPKRPGEGAINELVELSGLPRRVVIRMMATALSQEKDDDGK